MRLLEAELISELQAQEREAAAAAPVAVAAGGFAQARCAEEARCAEQRHRAGEAIHFDLSCGEADETYEFDELAKWYAGAEEPQQAQVHLAAAAAVEADTARQGGHGCYGGAGFDPGSSPYGCADYEAIARKAVLGIGLDPFAIDLTSGDSKGFDAISVGAGGRGSQPGYASDETESGMPLTHSIAMNLCVVMTKECESGRLWWLRPGGKTQVTIEYLQKADGTVDPIYTVAIYAQHAEPLKALRSVECAGYMGPEMTAPSMQEMSELIVKHVVLEAMRDVKLKGGQPAITLFGNHSHMHVSPAGEFIFGGKVAELQAQELAEREAAAAALAAADEAAARGKARKVLAEKASTASMTSTASRTAASMTSTAPRSTAWMTSTASRSAASMTSTASRSAASMTSTASRSEASTAAVALKAAAAGGDSQVKVAPLREALLAAEEAGVGAATLGKARKVLAKREAAVRLARERDAAAVALKAAAAGGDSQELQAALAVAAKAGVAKKTLAGARQALASLLEAAALVKARKERAAISDVPVPRHVGWDDVPEEIKASLRAAATESNDSMRAFQRMLGSFL